MQNKKTFITILLVFALVLGGSYLLYTKLSPLISADRISGQEQDTGDGSQESETEKILAPDITVYDINGNEVRLSDFAGKPVIMNFWASWCGRDARWKCRILKQNISNLATRPSL